MSRYSFSVCFLAYATIDKHFITFNVKCLRGFSFETNQSRSVYDFLRDLSIEKIAYAYPHEGNLYFLGDGDALLDKINEFNLHHSKNIIVLEEQKFYSQSLYPVVNESHFNIIKVILYHALRGNYAEKISNNPPYSLLRRRRAVELFIKGKIEELDQDHFIHYGLKFLFDISPEGYGVLWVDMVLPPIKRDKELHRVDPEELPPSIRRMYRSYASPDTEGRIKKIEELMESLTGNKNSIEIDMEDYILSFRKLDPSVI